MGARRPQFRLETGVEGLALGASAGLPILQVDHVKDLAKGGPDAPWNMIALCSSCHALKTYGENREKLRHLLAATARRLHAAKLS
ncbi:HNH endonuclease signature motif containing protein [Streptomyces sp. NPDC057582]|uniref:HNH endonuclease signature motif containing protein n=1 Tax=Streptomyces sp. NPDC057582 TaxID=3346174 RepID=UPI0036CE97C1